MKNVTIVIPVYKDWDTLGKCIESLKKYVSGEHTILLVNDMSPVWEDMEKRIQEAISGCKNFRYERNTENMGFVKTCNRAVFELDKTENDILLLNSDTQVTEGFLKEMQEVLYLAEKHGAVCPRSNNATIYTMPVKNSLGEQIAPEVSYSVFQQISKDFPRYTVMPTGVGFCLLIKRELIEHFGLFDEVYGKGYNEENDFCMRINQYGYNIVAANHAFVFHFESKSFGSAQRSELDAKNSKTLLDRYPYYSAMVNSYFQHSMTAVEAYADLLAEGVYKKKRLLFSLLEIPSSYNGTARYGLAIFRTFYEKYSDKYEIHLLINRAADEFFGLTGQYPHVWYPDNISGTFHLAFSPSQIFSIEHLIILNRVALKYVFCMQDIISIRSQYLLAQDYERFDVFRKSIEYCAGMTSISEFSLNDTKQYYQDVFEEREIPVRVIYHGLDKKAGDIAEDELPFEKYYLVYGNFYKHKFLAETIPELMKLPYSFIVLGAKNTGKISDNIYGYKSGGLSDEFVNEIAAKATGLIFPSVYEGFGLPILDGIQFDKKVLVTDNELNRELKVAFDNFSENIYLFEGPKKIGEKLALIEKDPKPVYKGGKKEIRTWDAVAVELEEFLAQILDRKPELEQIRRRWQDFHYIENIHRMYVPQTTVEYKMTRKEKILNFKVNLLRKHPKIFYFLHHVKRSVLKIKD